MQWITEVEKAKSVDELMTSQSILGRTEITNAGCYDGVFTEKASQLACSIPEMSKCRRAGCSKNQQILARKADCVHDKRVFSCNQRI